MERPLEVQAMKTLREQMLSYATYHGNKWNKLTHLFGVPLVVVGLFIPMGWFRFAHADIPLTGATLFFLTVVIYYWRLDRTVTLLQMPMTILLLWFADWASTLPFKESLQVFGATFFGGWIIQFAGHVFEGKRPALFDNIMQIFNAPLFLTLEFMFLLGHRKDLLAECEALHSRAPQN